MESQARGGTRWKRFGLVMVPSVAATVAIGVALSQGALAASFAVSGQEFKVTADRLDGQGFVQYGATVTPAGSANAEPVAVSAFNTADIYSLCQSVVIPGVPLIGNVTVRIEAGTNPDRPVKAENLFIDISQLNANATFRQMDIGVSVDNLTKGPQPNTPTLSGSFAQQAESATLTNVRQTAWATSAGTFELHGLSLGLHRGKNECY